MRAELQEIVDEFAESPKDFRLTILLDFANNLPPVPDRIDRDALEQVHECQTPFFVAAEVEDGRVSLHFDAPPEAPTTRGYAGVLAAGLSGGTADEVLDTPADFFVGMGLSAILARVKRQVVEKSV